MTIKYKLDLVNIDWDALKDRLKADNFDNGRTPEQLRNLLKIALPPVSR